MFEVLCGVQTVYLSKWIVGRAGVVGEIDYMKLSCGCVRYLLDESHGAIKIGDMLENAIRIYDIHQVVGAGAIFNWHGFSLYPGPYHSGILIETDSTLEQDIELLVKGQEEASPNLV